MTKQTLIKGLLPGEVALWFARPSQIKNLSDDLESLLTEAELEHMEGIHLPDFRLSYLVSRALLRTALSHYFHIPQTDWRFERSEYGKPVLSPEHGLTARFNTSHTDDLSVCAISLGGELGIDAECFPEAGGFMELAEAHFSDIELADLRSHSRDEQTAWFCKYWTLKESYIKAKGVGQAMLPLNSFSFRLSKSNLYFIPPGSYAEDRDWHFRSMEADGRYALALASSEAVEHLHMVHCLGGENRAIADFSELFDRDADTAHLHRI